MVNEYTEAFVNPIEDESQYNFTGEPEIHTETDVHDEYSDLTGTSTSTDIQDTRGSFSNQVSNDTGSLVSGIVTSVIVSGLAWLSYKFLWNKDSNDEQKQIMWRGIVLVLAAAAAWRWYKALFPN